MALQQERERGAELSKGSDGSDAALQSAAALRAENTELRAANEQLQVKLVSQAEQLSRVMAWRDKQASLIERCRRMSAENKELRARVRRMRAQLGEDAQSVVSVESHPPPPLPPLGPGGSFGAIAASGSGAASVSDDLGIEDLRSALEEERQARARAEARVVSLLERFDGEHTPPPTAEGA